MAARVGASLVVLVVADGLIGLTLCRGGRFLRWPLPPYGLIFNEEQARSLDRVDNPATGYAHYDPDLGWSIPPHGRSADGLFRANGAGFRADRDHALDPPPGTLRIAAFGDSYTNGDRVANDQTWPHQLEAMRTGCEVLNFGMNGYGTDQAFLRYRRDGRGYRPHVVLIGLMVENMLRNVNVYRPAYYHATPAVAVKPRFRLASDGGLQLLPCPARSGGELKALVESGRLLGTVHESDYWVARAPAAYDGSPWFLSSFVRIAYSAYENSGRRAEPCYADTASEPFRVTLAILRAFHDEALADGAKSAIVLVFPDRDAVRRRLHGGAAYWRTMTHALNAAGVPVIDMAPCLVDAARREGMEPLFLGNHYSPRGNAVVAAELAGRLVQDQNKPTSDPPRLPGRRAVGG